MPKTNKVPLSDGTEAELEEVKMGEAGFELKTCGHVNKHFYNAKGKLQDLACDLPKGHAGDHHATYTRLVPEPLMNEKGQVVEERYNQTEDEAYWGDAAGVPAKDIHAEELPQLSEFQKDLVAAILKKTPGIPVEEAIRQARNSPVWTAANA